MDMQIAKFGYVWLKKNQKPTKHGFDTKIFFGFLQNKQAMA
jgi:hypothetical protein